MDTPERLERIERLLEEIRDGQRRALEAQAESLALARTQHERAARLQDRAEAIQERGARIVASSRRLVPFVLGLVLVLIAYVTWLLWRMRVF